MRWFNAATAGVFVRAMVLVLIQSFTSSIAASSAIIRLRKRALRRITGLLHRHGDAGAFLHQVADRRRLVRGQQRAQKSNGQITHAVKVSILKNKRQNYQNGQDFPNGGHRPPLQVHFASVRSRGANLMTKYVARFVPTLRRPCSSFDASKMIPPAVTRFVWSPCNAASVPSRIIINSSAG